MTATEDFEWGTLMRPEWGDGPIVVRGYVTLRADRTGFPPNPKILDLGETRVAIFVGHIKYQRPQETHVRVRRKNPSDPPETPEPAIDLNVFPEPMEWTDPEFHTLIATPGSLDNAAEPLARIEETAGLLITFESTRLVLHQLFEMEVRPGPRDQLSVRSRPVLAPDEVREADVSDERFRAIGAPRSAIEGFDADKKNRILLSLRWLEAATGRGASSSTADVFLAYWIALEALAMDRFNITPLNDALARVYGTDAESAKARFLTEKIKRLRNGIVHEGKPTAVSPAILRYLEYLYVDVFFDAVGIPSENRAARFLGFVNVEQEVDAALA